MSSDPRECREQARECERIAMSSSDPRDGADYAALAYTWLKLAEIFEHDNAMLARWDKDSKVVPLSRRRPVSIRYAQVEWGGGSRGRAEKEIDAKQIHLLGTHTCLR